MNENATFNQSVLQQTMQRPSVFDQTMYESPFMAKQQNSMLSNSSIYTMMSQTRRHNQHRDLGMSSGTDEASFVMTMYKRDK